jgi:hypothetical protein
MPRQWQLDFFTYATRSDYEPVIRAVEATRNLKYILCGMFETPTPPMYTSGLDIPDLGIATEGDSARENNYLIMDAAVELESRKIDLYSGETRYAVDQWRNPQSISFRPGGVFEERCIIQGDLGTASRHPASVALCRAFTSEFTKRFRLMHGHWWVGPEALQRFQEGMRLTLDAKMRLHDLQPEPLALPPSPQQ